MGDSYIDRSSNSSDLNPLRSLEHFVEIGVGIDVVPCWVCEMVILFFLFIGSIVSFRALVHSFLLFLDVTLLFEKRGGF